ncbi:stage III sporulation protein AG [Aquibacillus koreensis]|uniref:Stage III sporulation protein AG n=1 Tax=Aquibacillus koreensis TaxID=279446 RepID=A0A9X3WI05_9BACI|nr:stage III sporulation protein AG [Aquibacillus koreensis]MCT2537522.1 stage III sporulation protein AG [Aquibacillus koreensis]MDC3418968.1 stage III sporulation protein AG [Aquibacillus koreensis]
MENPFRKLFSQLKLKTEDGKKPTKMGYILVIALIGFLVLIVSNMFQGSTDENNSISIPDNNATSSEEEVFLSNKEDEKTDQVSEIEAQYEEDLTNLLEKIAGISEVEVMVNLDSTKQKVFEKNLIVGKQTTEENDQNGGERLVEDNTEEQQVVIVRQGDQEVPLIVHTKKPSVRGVLVVAKGVDHIELQQWVVEAVSRVLDVPSHRISVMPKK